MKRKIAELIHRFSFWLDRRADEIWNVDDYLDLHNEQIHDPKRHPFETNGSPIETCLSCGWPKEPHLT